MKVCMWLFGKELVAGLCILLSCGVMQGGAIEQYIASQQAYTCAHDALLEYVRVREQQTDNLRDQFPKDLCGVLSLTALQGLRDSVVCWNFADARIESVRDEAVRRLDCMIAGRVRILKFKAFCGSVCNRAVAISTDHRTVNVLAFCALVGVVYPVGVYAVRGLKSVAHGLYNRVAGSTDGESAEQEGAVVNEEESDTGVSGATGIDK